MKKMSKGIEPLSPGQTEFCGVRYDLWGIIVPEEGRPGKMSGFWTTAGVISIKFKYQIQFGAFLRGHFGTPIDPAPVLLSGKSCSTIHA